MAQPTELKRRYEILLPHPQIIIIDETYPSNILTVPSKLLGPDAGILDLTQTSHINFSHFSSEGFAENPNGQEALANFYIQTFDLAKRGPLLDVGFGVNTHVSRAFAMAGIPSYALDVYTTDDNNELAFDKPVTIQRQENGVTFLKGDVVKVNDESSDVTNVKFGTVLFNGSWFSSGNNFTVTGEMLDFKSQTLTGDNSTSESRDNEQEKIIEICRAICNSGGIIGIISSRYAFHGGGETYPKYPREKLVFLDLYDRLRRAGAKKIYMVGMSQQGLDNLIVESYKRLSAVARKLMSMDEIMKIQRQLNTPTDIDVADAIYNPDEFEQQSAELMINSLKDCPELSKLARIDGIFAEF